VTIALHNRPMFGATSDACTTCDVDGGGHRRVELR
jgi:hypothetical protein